MPEATVAAIIINEGSEFVVERRGGQLRAFWDWLSGIFKREAAAEVAAASDGEGLPPIPVPAGHPSYVLLTRRNHEPFRDQWCLPGGHIDEYETAIDAVKREVSEETGLTLHPWFFTYFNEIIEAQAIHAVVLVYEGFATGTPRPEPAEVSAMRWFSVDVARKMDLAFTHNAILEAYAGRLVQPGTPD